MMEKENSSAKPLWRKILSNLGPGLVTGAADDDPSGIGTYSIAGAQFGLRFLWCAWITWPLMAIVQMACAHVGMVSGQGLAAALRHKLPRPLMLILCTALFLANTLNVGADLAAMADAAEMLTHIPSMVWTLVFGISISWATVRLPYAPIAKTLKWLALFLFGYVITAFLVSPPWVDVAKHTILPHWPANTNQWSTLVAILGTTISPYLFFWQASQEVEEEKSMGRTSVRERRGATPEELSNRWWDVGVGTFFSNLVMFFVILTAALTLNRHGITDIETSEQAAQALKPLAGNFASLLYTLGLVGTGLLAIPTLTGSAAYALAETYRWKQGLDEKFQNARSFYVVILVSMAVAISMDFANLNPVKVLYLSAVVNGVLAPVILFALYGIVRDKKLMCHQLLPRWQQLVLLATAILMSLAVFGMWL